MDMFEARRNQKNGISDFIAGSIWPERDDQFSPSLVIQGNKPESVEAQGIVPDDADGKAIELEQAYQSGFADGRSKVHAESEQLEEQRDSLATAISGLQCTDDKQLSQTLWQVLKYLLEQAVGEVQADEELLQSRCDAAIALVSKQHGNAVLHISAVDEGILQQSKYDIKICVDPDVLPGSVMLSHELGDIKAGTAALMEQLDDILQLNGANDASI